MIPDRATPDATTPAPARARFRERLDVLVLCAAAVVVAVLAHRWIYPSFSWNRDEPVYLWQIEALRHGHITPPDGGFPASFHPWLSGARDGVLFSQYTLGWPLVLFIGNAIFGTPVAGIAFGAGLAVLGTYLLARHLLHDHVVAMVAGATMVASPVFAIQAGIFLGYLFTTGLGFCFLVCLSSGMAEAKRGRIVAAGAMLGWIFLARPYDALLWGAVGAGWVLLRERTRIVAACGRLLWAGLGVLPLFAATLAYNREVTGRFTEFPITATDPLDKFGFGLRRIMPGFPKAWYDLEEAVRSTGKNILMVPLFMVGSYLAVVPVLVTLWRRRRESAFWVLVAVMAVFPIGYFVFWGMDVSGVTAPLSGPIYFIPAYGALSIVLAIALLGMWRSGRAWPRVALAVFAAVTVVVGANRIEVNRRMSVAQTPWRESVESLGGRALVFVADTQRYLLYLNPYSSNGPELDDRILYAVDRGPANIALMQAQPDRVPYLQRASLTAGEMLPRQRPDTPAVSLTPLTVERGRAVTATVRVTSPVGAKALVVCVRGTRADQCWPLSRGDGAGAFTVTLVPAGSGRSGPGVVPVGRGLGTVRVAVGEGTSRTDAAGTWRTRFKVPFRAGADGLEVLVPTVVEERRKLEDDTPYWRPVPASDSFAIEVTAR